MFPWTFNNLTYFSAFSFFSSDCLQYWLYFQNIIISMPTPCSSILNDFEFLFAAVYLSSVSHSSPSIRSCIHTNLTCSLLTSQVLVAHSHSVIKMLLASSYLALDSSQAELNSLFLYQAVLFCC